MTCIIAAPSRSLWVYIYQCFHAAERSVYSSTSKALGFNYNGRRFETHSGHRVKTIFSQHVVKNHLLHMLSPSLQRSGRDGHSILQKEHCSAKLSVPLQSETMTHMFSAPSTISHTQSQVASASHPHEVLDAEANLSPSLREKSSLFGFENPTFHSSVQISGGFSPWYETQYEDTHASYYVNNRLAQSVEQTFQTPR